MATVIEAMPGFTFGCDPELFVTDENGKYVSAAGLIPGTKEEPYPVKGGAVQVDGMAAEFNIDPVSTFSEFDANIVSVVKQLKSMLPKGYQLVPKPSVVFEEDVWEAAPEEAKILGCVPDFNAWTGEVNPPPDAEQHPRLRTASGHLHIGWQDGDAFDPEHVQNCRDLVKQLDWYLGGWSLSQDSDPTRRNLYGKAGACRFKPYGVEYRVLSNFWVSRAAMRLATWNRMQKAILDMRESFLPETFDFGNDLLIEAINTSQKINKLQNTFKFPLYSINV